MVQKAKVALFFLFSGFIVFDRGILSVYNWFVKSAFEGVICLKKMILTMLVLILIATMVACSAEPIGKISGAENEYITINDVKYILDTDNSFSSADKGDYLGRVSNSNITMKVYSVKGDTEKNYIYALWDWEGAFYRCQK